jgi:hypothetical protein
MGPTFSRLSGDSIKEECCNASVMPPPHLAACSVDPSVAEAVKVNAIIPNHGARARLCSRTMLVQRNCGGQAF